MRGISQTSKKASKSGPAANIQDNYHVILQHYGIVENQKLGLAHDIVASDSLTLSAIIWKWFREQFYSEKAARHKVVNTNFYVPDNCCRED